MSTIVFENGTKVKFEGNPTVADVEEVAQKLNIKSPSTSPAPVVASKNNSSLLGKVLNTGARALVPGYAVAQDLPKAIPVADKVGKFLGMGPLGEGLGYTINEWTGFNQQTRDAAERELNFYNSLPKETLRKLSAEGKLPQPVLANQLQDLTTGNLTNKQIIGSAIATALLATGGVASKGVTAGRFTPAISGLEKIVSPFGYAAAKSIAPSKLAPAVFRATTAALSNAPIGAATSGAITMAEGGSNKDIGKSALIGGIITGALPFAIEGGKIVTKGVARQVNKLLSIGSGEGNFVNEELARRGYSGDLETVKKYRKMATSQDLTNETKNAVRLIRESKNTAYQSEFPKLGEKQLDISSAQTVIKNKLTNDIRAKLTKDGIDFSSSKLAGTSRSTVEEAYNAISNWDDFSVGGVDALKQQLNEIAYNAKPKSKAQQFVIEAADKVGSILDKNVPGYEQMNSKYSDMTKILSDAEQVLGLKKTKQTLDINPQTVINKLFSAVKNRNDIQLDVLRKLSEISGKDLTGMVVGAASRDIIPRAGIGRAALGVMVPTTLFGPATLPQLMGTAAITSPKILGGAAIKSGQIARILENAYGSEVTQKLLPQIMGSISSRAR